MTSRAILEENKNVEEMLTDAAENAALQNEEEQKQNMVKIGKRMHESHVGEWKVSYILQLYARKEIVFPLCQRLYLWDQKRRDSLLDSLERGMKCGSIEIATREGESDKRQYLCDGLQRCISLLLLTNDPNLTEEQKQLILNTRLTVEIVYGLNNDEMSLWFLRLNSGVAVASAVKERSKLSERLNNAIIEISGSEFFRTISEKANATFKKNHHHELIAENILLACIGEKPNSNKAKDLCGRIRQFESDVINNITKAKEIVKRLENIYSNITDDVITRSMNANFASVLVYVLAQDDYTDNQIIDLINFIFAEKRAIKDYSRTTGSGAASADLVGKRYGLIVNLLNNPVSTASEFDQEKFERYCAGYKDRAINTMDGEYTLDFDSLDYYIKKQLFIAAEIHKDKTELNKVIRDEYVKLENEVA